MTIEVSRIALGRIIFHGVPSGRNDEDHSLTLSRTESPLKDQAKNYFRQKLVTTLINGAYPVVFDVQSTSLVPELVLNITTMGNPRFLSDSQIMAQHLYEIQAKSNAPGILAVAEVDASGRKALAIVKLEHEEGARALPINYQGELTFDVEHLQNLILTDKTRIFKAALFAQSGTDLGSIEGLASDNQIARGSKSTVADFFLRKFLGCCLEDDPATVTRSFLEAAQGWINAEVGDPSKKTDYMVAVLTEMKRNVNAIDPELFAREHLDLEDRQNFVEYIDSHGVPTTAFPKNTDLVEKQLRRVSMNLASGLTVIGTPDAFEEKVKTNATGDGQVEISITDRLTHVKGRG
ncbi:MAG: nucleoid-associated protein [Pirellulales bacterium]|nr:nucleoid-associated protein [Pirellulales bacterium]